MRSSINRRAARCLHMELLETRLVLSAYFVSTTGSDNAAGSQAAPWSTLQHAADVVKAGDTVTVKAGEYAGFDLRTDGTSTNRITFLAEPDVTINARNPKTPDGINLEGADYITIDGFQVVGMPRTGIRSVTNHHVIIRNNVLDQNYKWGILTGFSDDLLIEKNVASNSQVEHGIYVSNSGDRPVIRDNIVFGNHANGIHMNGDASLGGDGTISGALVERNVIYDNGVGGGSAINGDGVQDSIIRNNLIYNTHASGISLYRIDGGGGSSNNVVANNTVIVASNGRWALNIQSGSTGNTVRNNILYSYHSFRGSIDISADSLANFSSDYNVVMNRFTTNGGNTIQSLSQWKSSTGQDAHSLVATPAQLFVDAVGFDFHLSTSSPAIDAGTSEFAPAVDFEGTVRPQGTAIDIGADELGAVQTVNDVVGFDVQRGAKQRSYIRYVDLIFESADGLSDLVSSGRLTLTKYTLGGRGGTQIPLAGLASAVGNQLTLDFGTEGLGGNRNSAFGNGYYRLSIDTDGDGTTDTLRHFYRLLGDTNGDRIVNSIDVDAVTADLGKSGTYDTDVNGTGIVNDKDRTIVTKQQGKKLTATLPLDD